MTNDTGRKNLVSAQNEYMENRIRTASREQLLIITYEIGIKNCKASEHALREGLLDDANEHLQRAQNVVRELMITLRINDENPATKSLMALYDFMLDTLVQANVSKEPEGVSEVRSMFEELKKTWEETIAQTAKERSADMKEQYGGSVGSLPEVQGFTIQG